MNPNKVKMFDVFGGNCTLQLAKNNAPIYMNFNEKKWISNSEIIYTDWPAFKDIQGKSILIIGGGPSTNDWLETKPDLTTYDYIWSMNHFFLNPFLSQIPIALAMVSLEVNTKEFKFREYVHKFNTIFGIEWNPAWINKVKGLKEAIPANRLFCMHTRFYSKLGYAVRMIIFASELKASKVSFIGLDGPDPIAKGKHSFQPGKKSMPSGINSTNAPHLFARQYKEFWTYIEQHYPDVQYDSIDKSNQYHDRTSRASEKVG